MRIISFCAMVVSSNVSYVVVFLVSTPYGERKFSIRLSVRIIPTHEKYRLKDMLLRPVTDHGVAIYATYRSSQPPDYRTYSPKVTSSRSNLPVHRKFHAEYSFRADSLIIKEKFCDVNRFFSVFHENSEKILEHQAHVSTIGGHTICAVFLFFNCIQPSTVGGFCRFSEKEGTFRPLFPIIN